METSGWYEMHDHGYGERLIHHTAQRHQGDIANPRANDHGGLRVLPSLEEAKAFSRNQDGATPEPEMPFEPADVTQRCAPEGIDPGDERYIGKAVQVDFETGAVSVIDPDPPAQRED
jgi:hypothetical protein